MTAAARGAPPKNGHFAQRLPQEDERESRGAEKSTEIADPRSPEIAPTDADAGQSRGNAMGRIAELEAAIANVTRLLATADDDTAADYIIERKAMRQELEAALRQRANVTDLAAARARKHSSR